MALNGLTRYEKKKLYFRNQEGLIGHIYDGQRRRSIKRGHEMPNYTIKEFRKWMYEQKNFLELYVKWVDSRYEKEKKPSVDRIDDYKGYSFENIQLITWDENQRKPKLKERGMNHGIAKSKEHYGKKMTLRRDFKVSCEKKGWVFENFLEVYSGKNKWNKKMYKYYEIEREEGGERE